MLDFAIQQNAFVIYIYIHETTFYIYINSLKREKYNFLNYHIITLKMSFSTTTKKKKMRAKKKTKKTQDNVEHSQRKYLELPP